MNKRDNKVAGSGTILRGNFTPRNANDSDLKAVSADDGTELRGIEEFEKAARERIGGSIAFVTKLKDKKKDALLWDGEGD